MRLDLRKLLIVFACAVFALAPVADRAAWAQSSSPANCDPVTDPDQQFAENICSAHFGCALVVKAQRACAATKTFLKKIGDFFTLNGSSRPLTSNDVFEAAAPPTTSHPQARPYVAAVAKVMQGLPKTGLTKYAAAEQKFYFEGTGPIFGSQGPGVYISNNGLMQRGYFNNGKLEGPGQEVFSSGSVATGAYANDNLVEGVYQAPSGRLEIGRFGEALKNIGMTTIVNPDGASRRVLYDTDSTVVASGPLARPGQAPVDPAVPPAVAARLAALSSGPGLASARPAPAPTQLAARPPARRAFIVGGVIRQVLLHRSPGRSHAPAQRLGLRGLRRGDGTLQPPVRGRARRGSAEG